MIENANSCLFGFIGPSWVSRNWYITAGERKKTLCTESKGDATPKLKVSGTVSWLTGRFVPTSSALFMISCLWIIATDAYCERTKNYVPRPCIYTRCGKKLPFILINQFLCFEQGCKTWSIHICQYAFFSLNCFWFTYIANIIYGRHESFIWYK